MVILLVAGAASAQNVLPGYQGFWSTIKSFSVIDLLPYYPDQLGRVRNGIFAPYGREFATERYHQCFSAAPQILQVERPTLTPDQIRRRVSIVIEYEGDGARLTFTSPDTVAWSDPRIDFGIP